MPKLSNGGNSSAEIKNGDRKAGIDANTYALQSISYEHHEIHEGFHFYVSGYDENVDAESTVTFGFTTPSDGKQVHLTFEHSSTTRMTFDIYKDSEFTGGTATTPINNNHNSSNTSGSTLVKNPSITVQGTNVFSQSYGSAAAGFFGSPMAGLASREKELVLEEDTVYTIVFTSKDADNIISYLGEWYEHTPKEV